jgi:hypothetical protein
VPAVHRKQIGSEIAKGAATTVPQRENLKTFPQVFNGGGPKGKLEARKEYA